MKFLKLLFILGLFCLTIDAEQTNEAGENVSFSAIKLWRSYHKATDSSKCPVEAPWAAGVEGHYKGCKVATDKFRGDAREIGDTAVNSLAKYLTKLIYFVNSNSTIVTTGASTAVLHSLSKCMYLNKSGLNIIFQFEKVFLGIIEDFNKIIGTLSAHIGEVTCYLTTAVSDLGHEFSKYMKEFLESCTQFECKKKVDYECVLRKLQILMNTVALIDETLLNNCQGEATQEVREAVMVSNLIYFYLAIAVQGINSCALDVLYDRECALSQSTKSASYLFDFAVIEIGQAVWDMTFPFEKSLETLLTTFVNVTMAVNTAIKDIFGVFKGVEITVGEIKKNLFKGIAKSETDDRTNILKGVAPI